MSLSPRTQQNLIFSLHVIVFVVFISLALLLILNRAMVSGYNHDEDQFVASGYLFAKERLLPYVDYPYFHMPNLVFVYALLFQFIPYKLLAARGFSALCAIGIVSLLYWGAYVKLRRQTLSFRMLVAICLALLLLSNPLFRDSSGRAWNHDFSILLALMAAITLIEGPSRNARRGWIFLSGALLSLAIGVRSIWAVTIPAFLLTLWLYAGGVPAKQKLSTWLWFAGGGFLAMLPSIILFIMAPAQFIFDNIGYARLNTLFRQSVGYTSAMTLKGKLIFFLFNYREPEFWLLLIFSMIVIYGLSLFLYVRKKQVRNDSLFLMVLIGLIFLGAFIPTPSFAQYFYALVPFAILAILYQLVGISEDSFTPAGQHWAINLLILVVIFSGIYGLRDFPGSKKISPINTWFPVQAHSIGQKIAANTEVGKILTIFPIFVAEADCNIYPEFATGAFAWRIAKFLPADQRAVYGLISPDELEIYLNHEPPVGILVGGKPDLEQPFLEYAQKYAYKPEKISKNQDIWLP